jgi:integrase
MGIYLKRGKYYIDFYADGKRVRECVGKISRRKAENALKARQGEIVQGRYQMQRKRVSPTFGDFVTDFMEYSKAHKSSRGSESDETCLKHLTPFFGRYRLDQISSFLVEKYICERRGSTSRRGKPPASATINRELQVLKHLFNKAIAWEKAEKNPVRGIRFLKEAPLIKRVLSEVEESALLPTAAPHLRIAIILAINTGLRLGEILALRWKDIDLVNDLLTVEHGKGDKRREVEINSGLKAALLEFRKMHRTEYLFFNEKTGKPILTPKTAFHAAVRRAGIAHIRFHDLRHTFASRLVAGGTDLVTVQHLLGHASIDMTMRYAHTGTSERRRAVALLDERGHQEDTTKSLSQQAVSQGMVSSDGHHMDTTGVSVVFFDSAKSLKTHNVRP